jgi:hypothetical protein
LRCPIAALSPGAPVVIRCGYQPPAPVSASSGRNITAIALVLPCEWSFLPLPTFFFASTMICSSAAAVGRAPFRGRPQKQQYSTAHLFGRQPRWWPCRDGFQTRQQSSLYTGPLGKGTGSVLASGCEMHEANGIYCAAAAAAKKAKENVRPRAQRCLLLWCSRSPSPAQSGRGTCAMDDRVLKNAHAPPYRTNAASAVSGTLGNCRPSSRFALFAILVVSSFILHFDPGLTLFTILMALTRGGHMRVQAGPFSRLGDPVKGRRGLSPSRPVSAR